MKLRQTFPKFISKNVGFRYNAGEISATQALFIVRRDACLFASEPTYQRNLSFHRQACRCFLSGLCRSHIGRGELCGYFLIRFTAHQLGI